MNLAELVSRIVEFRDERDWKQFHLPQHLATAISIEAAELQEHFLWKNNKEVAEYVKQQSNRMSISDEVADVIIFCLLLTHELELDPAEIVLRKLKTNAKRYPVATARGSHAKAKS